jgi:hypothetical protein
VEWPRSAAPTTPTESGDPADIAGVHCLKRIIIITSAVRRVLQE